MADVNGCCAPAVQATCCEPADKAACCESTATAAARWLRLRCRCFRWPGERQRRRP